MASFLKGQLAKRQTKIIFAIFLLALIFRFFKLTEYPVSLSMDEVSIGYSAYSILETGRDEWGEKLPLAFKSVGDYKPPVNIYLTSLSIFIFGLNEFAVRFPVAFLGSLTVIFFIYLLKELGLSKVGYLFGGLWLAISPWHVHFSRGSFEAVTALLLVIAGAHSLLVSFRKKPYLYFSLSLTLFALSVWSYHAERLFVPILFIFLLLVFRNKVKYVLKNRKKLFLSLLPLLLLLIPFVNLTLFTPAIRKRAISTSIFREQSLIREFHYGSYESFAESVFNNDIYLIGRHIAGKYLNYFDLRFWFWKGMQFTPPEFYGMGLMYAVDLFLISFGVYALAKSTNKKLKTLSSFWFFAGPLPASFTLNEQHPLRALIWLPFFGMVAASAAEYFDSLKWKKKRIFAVGYFFFLLINIFYFADVYFRQFPRFFADTWQYGYKEIAHYACANNEKYENMFVTNTFGSIVPNNTGIPATYVRFYCRVDPNYASEWPKDLENINYRRIQWKSDRIVADSLIIGSYWDLLPEYTPQDRVIHTIYYPSGRPAFVFVDTRGLETGYYNSSNE